MQFRKEPNCNLPASGLTASVEHAVDSDRLFMGEHLDNRLVCEITEPMCTGGMAHHAEVGPACESGAWTCTSQINTSG